MEFTEDAEQQLILTILYELTLDNTVCSKTGKFSLL